MTLLQGYGARCFGTDWHADLALSLFDSAPHNIATETINVRLVQALGERRLDAVSPRMALAEDGFRLQWQQEATFDAFLDGTINVLPGNQWRHALPETFYSTVTATMLALRGMLPLHMSSVVMNDKAWLIGGASGAGKSSLTAQLVAAGAYFLADDLTILRREGAAMLATRGRPAMRLYPDFARLLEREPVPGTPGDARGKVRVRPHRRAADDSFPIGGVILLQPSGGAPVDGAQTMQALRKCVFRPRIMMRTAATARLSHHLLLLAATRKLMVLPAAQPQASPEYQLRVARLLGWMEQAEKAA